MKKAGDVEGDRVWAETFEDGDGRLLEEFGGLMARCMDDAQKRGLDNHASWILAIGMQASGMLRAGFELEQVQRVVGAYVTSSTIALLEESRKMKPIGEA